MRAWTSLLLLACALGACKDRQSGRAPPDDASAARAPEDATGNRFRVHASLGAALEDILASRPRVLGIGELHQTSATAAVKSTLRRFSDEALAVLSPRATDLLVETWIREGRCGATEARVNQGVTIDTDRPAATEDELTALARRARAADIEPHALTMSCADYESVQDRDGGIDYDVFLELIGSRLGDRALELHRSRPAGERGTIVVYGGALHNDLYPAELLQAWSYGPALSRALDSSYVELDLLIPEMIDARDSSAAEDWHPIYRAHAPDDGVLLIERRPRSFVLILPRGIAAEPNQ